MKALITKPASNGYNHSPKKELCAAYSVICKGKEIVCARSYMGKSVNSSVVYASIWVHGETYTAGTGKAGGYGYHKESAAFCDAIRSAGIELYGDDGESVLWPEMFSDREDAAREADYHAEKFAEICREDDAKWNAAREIEDKIEEMEEYASRYESSCESCATEREEV